jgi:23S rRNA pseudouridine1911/1915/1917 synthase
MVQKIHLTGVIPETLANCRADQALAKLFPDYSRARLSLWLKNQCVTINGKQLRPKDKILGGENVIIEALLEQESWEAESIPLNIIYEDQTLIIINKPAGLVVHPAHGNFEHTLVNALLHHCPSLTHLPRAGLIHRLDKDTTGLLIIAKTLTAHHALVKDMQERKIQRLYQAIVYVKNLRQPPPLQGTIQTGFARHPHQRLKMAVSTSITGKVAITHTTRLGYYPPFAHFDIKLETGRTHQIRVHLAHINLPIVGDPLYGISGPQLARYNTLSSDIQEFMKTFQRQALHAYQLSLIHPETQEKMTWKAPLPDDMKQLLTLIKNHENPHE